MDVVHRLIIEHGAWFYPAAFAWTFIEGETFVLVAGFAAAEGLLNAPLLLLVSWLGSFAGDQCYFWIGRHFGLRLLSRRPLWRARVDSALVWVKRYDKWFILTFRFIYGIRNVSSFALGISAIGWRRFLFLNLTAALLWATTFVGAGYFCGRFVERSLGELGDRFGFVMLGAFTVVLVLGILIYRLHRRRRGIAAAAQTSG
jgi:membrane protein DedA with SNARE-associated domain